MKNLDEQIAERKETCWFDIGGQEYPDGEVPRAQVAWKIEILMRDRRPPALFQNQSLSYQVPVEVHLGGFDCQLLA